MRRSYWRNSSMDRQPDGHNWVSAAPEPAGIGVTGARVGNPAHGAWVRRGPLWVGA